MTLTRTMADRRCGPPKLSRNGPCHDRVCPGAQGMPREFQAFPTEGALFANLDLSKPELEKRLAQLPHDVRAKRVRSYKMTSVSLDEGSGLLQHEGSGPNFQGGYLTLCTCMFQLRAECKEWQDWWIAGFCNLKPRWLVYLAEVCHPYDSYSQLWNALPVAVRNAKSATRHTLGDIYQPNPSSACADPYNPAHYSPPIEGHTHEDWWKEDVVTRYYNRHPALLVAKPKTTFLWQTPTLFLTEHHRNQTWNGGVTALMSKLRTV